ncbi:MAG: nicotinamide-nucleotide adenylyltransferase [Thermoplasmata archaeon HGW-Thermoplasmata-1]|nr:MAG: nicotinamide-nucleotide adenylyltransferase [Thermoplasmata archaeon HGW-Thermoplasmata-1]
MKALLIGRFQPFHNGHLELVRKAASEYESVIIAIGSANLSHTQENPFTAGERYLMIQKALESVGIRNFSIVPVPDINRYAVWVSHVVSLVPPFDVVLANNPLTKQLFSEAGYEVKGTPLYDRENCEATNIRKLMAEDRGWKSFVPHAVACVIDGISGIERMRCLAESDKTAD